MKHRYHLNVVFQFILVYYFFEVNAVIKKSKKHIGIYLIAFLVGALGGGLGALAVLKLNKIPEPNNLATWFGAIGTVAAVVVSLVTSKGAMKVAKYNQEYDDKLYHQVNLLVTKIDHILDIDDNGVPTAYTGYKQKDAAEFEKQLVNDISTIRSCLSAIRMLGNGRLDRETITKDLREADTILYLYKGTKDETIENDGNNSKCEKYFKWQRHIGLDLYSIKYDFEVLRTL